MNKLFDLHTAGHSLGLWLFEDTNAWFEFVLHIVLIVMPSALAIIILAWFVRAFRQSLRRDRQRSDTKATPRSTGQETGVFGYLFKHTRRSQYLLLLAALGALPLLYAGLELPKVIINNAIDSGHFPVEIVNQDLSQSEYLFFLSGLYLAVILFSGSIKYTINVYKGRVAERLLRRLRLTIYRRWRSNAGQKDGAEVIPLLVQEVEPIGGFAGDAFVFPFFQGGTFVTILVFMFMQDPILGAAAVTLLPVQLSLIPRLQKKINRLTRRRTLEMRELGGVIGREMTNHQTVASETRQQVTGVLRRVAEIRFEIYRKKFFMKGLNNLINQLTPFFFYTVGGFLVIEDRLSFGALVAVLAAHKDFSAPLKELLKYYQTMEDVRVRFEEIGKFLRARERSPHCIGDQPHKTQLSAPQWGPHDPSPAAPVILTAIGGR